MPTPMQTLGIGIATTGLLMIFGTVGFDFSAGAFAVLMISPISFAVGNLLLRQARDVPMFDLFAWLCLVPPLPLLALALLSDGPQATWNSLIHMSLTGLLCTDLVQHGRVQLGYTLSSRLVGRKVTSAPFAVPRPQIIIRVRFFDFALSETSTNPTATSSAASPAATPKSNTATSTIGCRSPKDPPTPTTSDPSVGIITG